MDEARDERLGEREDDGDVPVQVRRVGSKAKVKRARAGHHDERLASERGANERDLTADRELTEADRLEMFRASRFQSVLPDLPTFPGYHVMWLTTTNARDSIQNRIRMGYELIRIEECPGWDGVGLRVGRYDNVVGVNEMVAARITLRLYNLYMREAHHTGPLDEEMKLRDTTHALAEQAERLGMNVEVGDGTAQLGKKARPMPVARA